MKKKKMEKKGRRERKGGGRCAPAARSATHGVRAAGDGARGRRGERKKERGKKRGGIRGGRTRRVALDGEKMGRELNSGVGLFRRNSGTRVQGLGGVELNDEKQF